MGGRQTPTLKVTRNAPDGVEVLCTLIRPTRSAPPSGCRRGAADKEFARSQCSGTADRPIDPLWLALGARAPPLSQRQLDMFLAQQHLSELLMVSEPEFSL